MCFFAPNLKGGSVERVVAILAAHFVENGYKVNLVLTEALSSYLANIPIPVNIIDLKCKKVVLSLPKIFKFLRRDQSHKNWKNYVRLLETRNPLRICLFN